MNDELRSDSSCTPKVSMRLLSLELDMAKTASELGVPLKQLYTQCPGVKIDKKTWNMTLLASPETAEAAEVSIRVPEAARPLPEGKDEAQRLEVEPSNGFAHADQCSTSTTDCLGECLSGNLPRHVY